MKTKAPKPRPKSLYYPHTHKLGLPHFFFPLCNIALSKNLLMRKALSLPQFMHLWTPKYCWLGFCLLTLRLWAAALTNTRLSEVDDGWCRLESSLLRVTFAAPLPLCSFYRSSESWALAFRPLKSCGLMHTLVGKRRGEGLRAEGSNTRLMLCWRHRTLDHPYGSSHCVLPPFVLNSNSVSWATAFIAFFRPWSPFRCSNVRH